MSRSFTLISHVLCPYVQRVAIVLAEKNIPYERVDIDLANKPEWFLRLSPMGRTPLLIVDETPIFESSVICDFLDESFEPRMHPRDLLLRAQHRGWMEFGAHVLNQIAGFYNAGDAETVAKFTTLLRSDFFHLEKIVGGGPYFTGRHFSLVDAAFAPVFRYFDVFEQILAEDFFANLPKLKRWRTHLSRRASVRSAVAPGYQAELVQFLRSRCSVLSQQLESFATI